jgi:mannose-6-phosphate isomerase-like protein (cupin superfamily)
MPTLIKAPKIITAAGNKPKRIEEYAGRASTGQENVSVARMVSPGGWEEPAQRPEFDEISVVLRGALRVETEEGVIDVLAGQAVIAHAGEYVRYSTPGEGGAEYVAICIPAFSPQTVHRLDDEGSQPAG